MTDTMSDPITPAISIRRVTKRFGSSAAVPASLLPRKG